MPRSDHRPKEESFNFRVDAALKTEFQAAAEAVDKPAAQLLRDFMRLYVARRRHRDFLAEARRQSEAIAARAASPDSDEAAIMRELDGVLTEMADEWK